MNLYTKIHIQINQYNNITACSTAQLRAVGLGQSGCFTVSYSCLFPDSKIAWRSRQNTEVATALPGAAAGSRSHAVTARPTQ